jgi:hypothetical protein
MVSKQTKYRLGRGVLIVLIVLAIISLVFAAATTINSFKDQTNPFNATLEAGINNTQYIRIPRYAYAQNITMVIRGIEVI